MEFTLRIKKLNRNGDGFVPVCEGAKQVNLDLLNALYKDFSDLGVYLETREGLKGVHPEIYEPDRDEMIVSLSFKETKMIADKHFEFFRCDQEERVFIPYNHNLFTKEVLKYKIIPLEDNKEYDYAITPAVHVENFIQYLISNSFKES